MKIVVFRATGGTRIKTVKQALDKGHEVTVIARSPVPIEESHPRLSVVNEDTTKSGSFAETLKESRRSIICAGYQ